MSATPIPVLGSEQPPEAFYAPAFALTILREKGAPRLIVEEGDVGRDVIYDVESVTYVDNVEEADTFSLAINNWDAQKGKPKYVGYPTKPRKDPQLTWATLFEPGRRFELALGYRAPASQRRMMTGHVTNFDATFPQSGPLILKVDAQDAARKLGEDTFSYRWADKRDSDIAGELAGKPAGGRPGIDFPIQTNAQAAGREARHPRVVMRRKSVMDFLLERAKRHCYSVFRRFDGGKETLYFGPSELLPDGPYTLEWGRTLLEFHPTLKVAKQAKQATVRSWDRGTRKELKSTAKLSDFKLAESIPTRSRNRCTTCSSTRSRFARCSASARSTSPAPRSTSPARRSRCRR